MHVYEIRRRKDHRGVDLISDALPFGRLWYEQAPDAVDYAKFFSRSYRAVIRVYDAANNVIETHEHTAITYYHPTRRRIRRLRSTNRSTGCKESGIEIHHLIKTKQPKIVVNEVGPVTEAQLARLFRVIEAYLKGVARRQPARSKVNGLVTE